MFAVKLTDNSHPTQLHRAQFHGSAYAQNSVLTITIIRLLCKHQISAQALVTYSMHAHKKTFLAYQWNVLDVSAKFPGSVRADFERLASRAMKLVSGGVW